MALYATKITATPAATKQYGATFLTIARAKVTHRAAEGRVTSSDFEEKGRHAKLDEDAGFRMRPQHHR
jgi:hypothetical protein